MSIILAKTNENKWLKISLGSTEKSAILVMRAWRGKLKATPVSNTSKQTLHPIIRDNIMADSTIYTDNNSSYSGAFRQHKVVNHSAQRYINEFSFCLNEENCQADTIDKMKVLVKELARKRLSYKELIK